VEKKQLFFMLKGVVHVVITGLVAHTVTAGP